MPVATVNALDHLDRTQLAALVLEHLLAGHLIDRSAMPQVMARFGNDAMRDVAIDEWMGASPVYTRRMQRLLRMEGDDVETMFKNLQFDIGSPPQYMDFRFAVHDRDHGEFWLASCGALLDVEPMGDELVTMMCHAIEDPTFDATACAVNPKARVRPIHRPPRQPADRHPHCHWTVTIDEAHEPLGEPAPARRIGATKAAALPIAGSASGVIAGADGRDEPGRRDYAGPLEQDLDLTQFSGSVLRAVSDEVCLQGHLLAMSALAAVEDRFGAEAAKEIGHQQLIGVGGVVAERLCRGFGLGGGPEAIAAVLDLHPALRPRSYAAFRVELDGEQLTLHLDPCTALDEERELTWPMLVCEDHRSLDAIVHGVD
ncbi:MAG: hypothetical protein N2037_09570, partial [Acidimicrobiales bacterium]|nr:hypothetical protein [Acidimicrobiales bacterium]